MNNISAGGIATTIACAFVDQFAKIHQMNPAVITWLASSAAADICITASLVWSLVRSTLFESLLHQLNLLSPTKHKRKTGHSKTDDMINRLIRRRSCFVHGTLSWTLTAL